MAFIITFPDIVERACDALTHDGARHTLPHDKGYLKLRIEQDDTDTVTEINGAECYGRVAWAERGPSGYPKQRPEGFDGDAMKLRTYHGDAFWWQPLLDVWGVTRDEWTPERIAKEKWAIENLMTFGFQQVGVELWVPVTDPFGGVHTVMVFSHWLGGIDSIDDGYLREVVRDLVHELHDPITVLQ